jgi:hypothetical protein
MYVRLIKSDIHMPFTRRRAANLLKFPPNACTPSLTNICQRRPSKEQKAQGKSPYIKFANGGTRLANHIQHRQVIGSAFFLGQ